jgi:hypothetical protein
LTTTISPSFTDDHDPAIHMSTTSLSTTLVAPSDGASWSPDVPTQATVRRFPRDGCCVFGAKNYCLGSTCHWYYFFSILFLN